MANYNSLYTGAQIDSAIGALNTALQPSDIANFETSTELNARDSDNRDRANHTGTQLASTISDFNSSVTSVVNGLGLSTLDSTSVSGIIDSAYVQARQDYAYSSLTGIPTFLDSALVTQLIDSDYVQLRQTGINILELFGLVDSAYVQERQDFAYASLTGAPNVLDSGDVTTIIDSDYIQARQLGVDATGIDSAEAIQLIDSDYIESRRPSEAIFNVVNNGTSAYVFTGDGFPVASDDNPLLKLTKGLTYKFNINASGHPFQIRTSDGGSAYNDGVTNNGADSGSVIFTVPMNAPDTLYYQCTVHSGMGASIVVNELSGSTTDAVPEGSTNLYYTSARVDSDVRSLVDSAYVQARQDFAYSSLTGTPTLLDSALVTQLIDSAYIALRSPAAEAGLDSALTEQFIDSAYVQARQDFAYSSLTGAPTALSAFTNDTLYLDSATATQLIDSAYIQLRQSSVGTGGLDSALVTQLIDSAYVQLRETPQDFSYASLTGAPTALSAFTNDTLYLDSTTATQLIDSAYIQLRQSNVGTGGVDSAYVTSQINALIDGAPGALDTLNELAAAINDDSQAYNTLLSLVNAKIDSAVALTLITTTVDSAYVQLRQSSVGTGGLDSAGVRTLLADSSFTIDGDGTNGGVIISDGSVEIKTSTGSPAFADFYCEVGNIHRTRVKSAPHAQYSGNVDVTLPVTTGTLALTSDITLDSAAVISLIDSAYVQLRQSSVGTGGLDSALVTQLIDSAYVQLRQDFAYSSLTGKPNVLDSADVAAIAGGLSGLDSNGVVALVDSAYVQLRQDFAYASLTGAPTVLDSALITQLIDSAYVALRAPAASGGGLDSAAANTLIDAKIQVVDIADIVGSTGNPGEYLKSLGNGNATWENVTTVIDSAYVTARVTGTLSAWQKKSENYTLAVGDRIAVNTDSAWTLTLPASPSFSDEVYIIDATGNAAVKNITVSGNSQKILASDSDLIVNVNRASIAMMFYGDSQGWILTSAF